METPSFGSVPLVTSQSLTAGAAFELQKTATASEAVALDGWEVEVAEGAEFVVARGGEASCFEDALRDALHMAQRGLDILSMRGANNLLVKNYNDDHLVWWPGPNGLVVRVVSYAPLNFNVPPAELVVKDRQGNITQQKPPRQTGWHESFRYFRLSQATDDLFDAFRNAYLALESILSSIAPQKVNSAGRVNEREGDWFKRALREANRIVTLSPFVPNGTNDAVQYLWNDLYQDTRSAMSHAKSGRKILLPQSEADRDKITASLLRLVRLYLKLAEQHLGARRAGGGIFAVFFRNMWTPTLEDMQVFVSNDEAPFKSTDTVPNPNGGELHQLTDQNPVSSPTPFAINKTWAAPSSRLSDLPYVRRIVGTKDHTPVMAAVLNARLTLSGTECFEAMLGIRAANTRQPREQYSF